MDSSPEISPDDVHQLLRCLCLVRGRSYVRIGDMEANVSLNDFSHQPIDRAAAGGNGLEYDGTILFFLQRLRNTVDLPAYALHTIQQLLLIPDHMSHEFSRRTQNRT